MQLIEEYVEVGFVSYCDSFAVDVIVDSVEMLFSLCRGFMVSQ